MNPMFELDCLLCLSCVADGLAYSALLKNELLGAGIDKVQDPQSEDRRLQPSTPVKRSLFSVGRLVAPPMRTSTLCSEE